VSDKRKRIAIIVGHPDPAGQHFGHALASAYERGARDAGHEVKMINVARLDFPLLRSATEWEGPPAVDSILEAQHTLDWAEHVVIFFPLWLGDMPAVLKGFFEQTLRPGFAFGKAAPGRLPKKRLGGRSARIVVTMGMPALFYRMFYRAHSVNSLRRNILGFVGFRPVRTSLIGMVEGRADWRGEWLMKLSALGALGA
jgi:putative NADPH-quinone reductase